MGLAAACVVANVIGQPMLMGLKAQVLIPGLADLLPAWNRGISFGLMAQDSQAGRALLIGFLSVIAAVVAILAWRAITTLTAAGYGLILGGAIANLIDRIRFEGAVFDFLSLHLGRLPLFVCNLPDIFISAGFVLLVLDMMLAKPEAANAP